MKAIIIEDMQLYSVALPLAERLRTSFGEEPFKTAILAQITTQDGYVGWGECSVEIRPGYSSETMGTALHVLREFLVPALIGQTVARPTDVPALLAETRGHPLSKHGLEAAVWDVWAQANGMSLSAAFAAHLPDLTPPRSTATVGVSIGIKPTIDATLMVIEKRLTEGYGRIKLKIEPGWDVELAQAVRAAYPDITLMLDANSAYTLADADHLKRLDAFNLLMLEQPLAYNDIYQHSKLQPQLATPICLDESILTADDVRLALELGACRIINLKPGRVGGFTESLKIYQICVERQVPLWIGGMLETGVGRAANVAFAALPGVTLPCDISATDRYFEEDITEPPFILGLASTLAVPQGAGIGVMTDLARIERGVEAWQQAFPYTQQ